MESAVNPADDNVTYMVQTFVTQFEDAESATYDARRQSEKCRDYFDDKQLTDAEKQALEKRGQPAVVFNEIKPKVKTLLGLEKQTRKDPKAFPRNPQDEDAGERACAPGPGGSRAGFRRRHPTTG